MVIASLKRLFNVWTTPRGHMRTLTSRLIARPSATSTTRAVAVSRRAGVTMEKSTMTTKLKAACPMANEKVPGVGGEEQYGRKDQPPELRVGSEKQDQDCADQHTGPGSDQRLAGGAAGSQGIEAQCAQRAQHDPERMLQGHGFGDRDADGKGHG